MRPFQEEIGMNRMIIAILSMTLLLLAVPAFAGVVVYEEGDKKIEIGGRVQVQYHMEDPDGGGSSDELFFRRLRPYVLGSVTKNWSAKIQFDLGKATGDNEVAVKDAWMRYGGWTGLKLTIGNQKMPFSRESLTSSKRQQLVERTFVGDHNYGTPDRMIGVRLDGHNESNKVTWGIGLGAAEIDPDADKMDFDSSANHGSDWNEGVLVAGRVDFHPWGHLKMAQGDFDRKKKLTVSLAAFTWSNDDDNNGHAESLDSADGVELSFGFRAAGWSVDGEYQMISGDSVNPVLTSGMYLDGTTDLDKYAIEGGYMVKPGKVEIVAGYQSLDADNFQESWNRTSVGANYFWNKHKSKAQLTYRMGENLHGVTGVDSDELFLQFQQVF
jgi:phosphate-selective porin OprO/OprP